MTGPRTDGEQDELPHDRRAAEESAPRASNERNYERLGGIIGVWGSVLGVFIVLLLMWKYGEFMIGPVHPIVLGLSPYLLGVWMRGWGRGVAIQLRNVLLVTAWLVAMAVVFRWA